MLKNLILISLAASALTLAACNKEAEPAAEGHTHANGETHADHATVPVVTSGAVHSVACGCSLEEGGACANFVEVDGEFVPLAGDIGLGEMEFCGQTGLQASLTGAMVDGTFVATSYELQK